MAVDTNNTTSNVSLIGTYETLKKERKPTNEMGKDQFLQMLITQMKSQDPMSPMQDNEFMSQMTQFSMLEQLQNMSLSFSQSQAYSMIGKGIYAIVSVPDSEGNLIKREITGIVDSTGTDSGKQYVMVSGTKISVDDIKQVFNSDALTGNSILSGAAVIGKYVTAEVTNENNVKETISGIVEGFSIKNGIVTFKVNGKEFLQSQITSMSSTAPAPVENTDNSKDDGGENSQDTNQTIDTNQE